MKQHIINLLFLSVMSLPRLTVFRIAAAKQIIEGSTFRDHGQVCRNFRFYWPTAQLCLDNNSGRDGQIRANSNRTLTRVDLRKQQQYQFAATSGKAYAHLTATPDGTWWFTSPDKMRLCSFRPPADQTGSADSN